MRTEAILVCLSVALCVIPSRGAAQTVDVPQTGQEVSYVAGDDGDTHKGSALPSPRFTDNGDGTVTDNLTQLIWLKDAACLEIHTGVIQDWANTQSWYNALTAASTLQNGDCGLSDNSVPGEWRLPNVREIKSLTNNKFDSPTLSNTAGTGQWTAGDPFDNVKNFWYWSSTTYVVSTVNAIMFDMKEDIVSRTQKSDSYAYVWPVKGTESLLPKTGQVTSYRSADDAASGSGVALASPRFTDNGDGTITDNLTGLIWLQNPYCAGKGYTWEDALAQVVQLNTDGTMNTNDCGDISNAGSHQTDWRLPNRNELWSLLNFEYASPAVSNTAGDARWTAGDPFTSSPGHTYWSSTTEAVTTYLAFSVALDDGHSQGRSKTTTWPSVWAVRGGITVVPEVVYSDGFE